MITLEAVSKRYGPDNVAVRELSLGVAAGEVCMLVGPSGCGKTTTLRMINRLIEPSGGRILLGGRDVLAMDPVELRRGIGYVIQQGGLFPHRRVFDNVATVPRLLGWDRERTKARVEELLELVGLDPAGYGRRYPHELSGGERQRVGVARALGADPPVLLMDEPFGAVDPVTRQRLQQQLLDLQATLGKTIVFVTHDIEEAAKLGDRVAVLSEGGVLEQFDTPAEILGRPATPFVADFVGADRGVRRLAVVAIEERDLFFPLVVAPSATMAEAATGAGGPGAARDGGVPGGTDDEDGEDHRDGDGSRWAVVVDGDGSLVGWVPVDAAAGGTVADHVEPFAVRVPVGASLRSALGEMLQHDIAWVPVVDGDRYLGVLTPNRIHAAMRRSVGGQPVEP
ncbi:MAG TPA: ATP-binding cassette domain-containing protein [Acidimicrobiales bacterium]|nr:ATP-binding cassette domain-containing protein [Acidimicrobiales bacterium]